MYKQLILVREDLNMSTESVAKQVANASIAYFVSLLKANVIAPEAKEVIESGSEGSKVQQFAVQETNDYRIRPFTLADGKDICNAMNTAMVFGAKDFKQLMRAVEIAQELGLKENEDYFLERGKGVLGLESGEVVTAVGFRPLPQETVTKILRGFALFPGQVFGLHIHPAWDK